MTSGGVFSVLEWVENSRCVTNFLDRGCRILDGLHTGQRGSHVFGPPKRTPVFSVAKDARNSPDVQACSPVQRFLRGWFCGIASTNSSHTIPANLTPVDSSVEAPPSLPLLCHSLTRLPHPHGAQILVAADGSVCALGARIRLDSVLPRASGTSCRRRSLRNRAPGRWRHRGRSGAPGAQVLLARV